MSSEIALTPTSFIVLGLLEVAGPSTPYELKQGVAASVGNFWTVPHSQLYAEPGRLARAGLVTEEREETGRRRRRFALTAAGRDALARWRLETDVPLPELRDLALLKVFFGADPSAVATARLAAYREQLAAFEALHAALSAVPGPRGPLTTLEAGIEHAKVWIAYWERLRLNG